MFQRIRAWLGIDKGSQYYINYFDFGNMRSAIYMSAVIITLEVWMLYNLFTILRNDPTRTTEWIVGHLVAYLSLLAMAVIQLVHSIHCIRKNKNNHKRTVAISWIFAMVAIAFGIYICTSDYRKGEQIFTFVSMLIFALCLLHWRPLTVLFLSVVSFAAMYFVMVQVDAAKDTTPTLATQINFFVMWICVTMCALANYSVRRREALQSENLNKAYAALEEYSQSDVMTGMQNVYSFRENVLSLREGDALRGAGILFLNIVNFRTYNEGYGLECGDRVLKDLGNALQKEFLGRPAARISDDHFIVFSPLDVCEEAYPFLFEALRPEETHLQRLRAGFYPVKPDEPDINIAIDRARVACRHSTGFLSDGIRVYDKDLEMQLKRKSYIVSHLDKALRDGSIQPLYQPVVSLDNNEIYAMEALARWKDEEAGLIRPAEFIPILEEYHLIHILDEYILTETARMLKNRMDAGEKEVPVSINLSRLDFELCDVPALFARVADENKIPHHLLNVELTETSVMKDPTSLFNDLTALKENGFRIWLDDFGSGFSSLNVLKDFAFDMLKIDMEFLEDFAGSERARSIIENVVHMSRDISAVSLIEGVENEEQAAFLRNIGCEKAQGFYFARPTEKEQLKV